MKTVAAGIIAGILCASFFVVPAGLEAKGRRGALIIVTKVDGVQVKGELFLVKPESLLVLRRGAALTIPRGMVHSVSIQHRSGLARGALSGFATGAILGFLLGTTYDDHFHSNPAVPVGAAAGGLGLAIGMVASRREKVESVVPLSGLSGPAANERWNALGAHSRKGRAKGSARRP